MNSDILKTEPDSQQGGLMVSPDWKIEWSYDDSTLPKMWMTAFKQDDGTYLFKLDKTIARLVVISESESEIVFRLEPKE